MASTKHGASASSKKRKLPSNVQQSHKSKKVKGLSADVDRDPEIMTRFILGFFVLANLSFNVVHHPMFRSYLKYTVPWYELPARRTFLRRLNEAYAAAQSSIKGNLSGQSFFSATFDLATVMNSARHFIVITVHYYDKVANSFKSMTIGAQQMLFRSTAEEIKTELQSALGGFGIPIEKVGAVCTDGGKNVIKACRILFGVSKHLECTCHILDNVIKESIKSIPALGEIIAKLKRIVKFFKQSYVAANKLRQLQMSSYDCKLSQCRMLLQSVPTRWNSILKSMVRFLDLSAFVRTIMGNLPKDALPDEGEGSLDFPEEIVSSLEDIKMLLLKFEELTRKFSSNSSVVSSKAKFEIDFLCNYIEHLNLTDPVAIELREKLLSELDKRYAATKKSPILTAANILDPRFKGCRLPQATYEEGDLFIRQCLKAKRPSCNAEKPSSHFESVGSIDDFFEKPATGKVRTASPEQELRVYQDSPVERNINEDVLMWWKNKQHQFPTLSQVALELLTIPVSSVASERTVSTLNRILSDRRTRLTNDNINKLTVLVSMPYDFWESYIGVKFAFLPEEKD